jgi:hypothetical protein
MFNQNITITEFKGEESKAAFNPHKISVKAASFLRSCKDLNTATLPLTQEDLNNTRITIEITSDSMVRYSVQAPSGVFQRAEQAMNN